MRVKQAIVPKITRGRPAQVLGATILSSIIALVAEDSAAQTLSGRVLEDGTEVPMAGAEVSLLTRDGERVAEATSAADGLFTLAVPEPGEFVVQATRLGYAPTRSPLLSLVTRGNFSMDIAMSREPIGLEGLEVSVEAEAEEFLQPYGHTPASLGNRWISRKEIEETPYSMGSGQLIRWRGIPGVGVHGADASPGAAQLCVTFQRGRTFQGSDRCALILFNGGPISPRDAQALSPDEIEAIAILTPTDATTFYGTMGGGGVVLIWSRRGWQ